MNINIITVGSKPDSNLSQLINDLSKRFNSKLSLNWHYIKNGQGDTKSSINSESEEILRKISKDNYVILLDESGEQLTSPQLSQKLFSSQKDITFIIGGAYGVSPIIFDRSDFIWSLSKLVFPHQIVRLILTEQIYRAYTISISHPYHHK